MLQGSLERDNFPSSRFTPGCKEKILSTEPDHLRSATLEKIFKWQLCWLDFSNILKITDTKLNGTVKLFTLFNHQLPCLN